MLKRMTLATTLLLSGCVGAVHYKSHAPLFTHTGVFRRTAVRSDVD